MTGNQLLTPWEQDHGMMTPDQVNITDPSVGQPEYVAMIATLHRENPFSYYYYDGDPGYDGFWIATSNDIARKALNNTPVFSSYGTEKGGGLMLHDLGPEIETARELMIMQDGRPHALQRKLVDAQFQKKGIREIEEFLTGRAKELVSDALASGEVDFVSAIAKPLPLDAIVQILGIPDDERDIVFEYGDKITMVDNPKGSPGMDLEAAAMIIEAAGGIRAKVAAGEIHSPVLTGLFNAVYDPETEQPTDERFITPFQFDSFFVLLFLAGNETTRNTLSHAAQAFSDHPEQWDALRQNPGMLGSAVGEAVRWATPVRYVRRTALEDTEFNGRTIHEGQKVLASLTGASRDPNLFDNPHEFDITRNSSSLTSFGQGDHFCLGSHLAKMEIRVVLDELLRQVDRIKQIGPSERQSSILINNLGSLPVRLYAAKNPIRTELPRV